MLPRFDHERLEVYVLELNFTRWLTPLLDQVKECGNVATSVRDHLDRACLSVVLNTAEGNGKRMGRLRQRFFDDARGSATECAACLDVLVARGAATDGRVAEGKAMLVRIVQMLTRLIEVAKPGGGTREEAPGYRVEGEGDYEHDYEYEDD